MLLASNRLFLEDDAQPWETVGAGVRRKVLTYDSQLMLVQVEFEAGSIGAPHRHVHTQMTHIVSGIFNVTIDGVMRVLQAGDTFHAPSNVVHGVVCVEKGVLLDAFSPMREDFV
ncbi:cupin domain-containing protein [Microvirga sp. STR05]|uniref:Cupin domain-containing protein n=1 Tax=Hymenobacter duratus TaxID=2771356 RepID=A0ABR8JL03_9BACT|nr:cupin domain-containing protein [Hymenobacter duratus]MBD2715224.1 cupin domain-containing protein [Hymenobacter duratus]MBR7950131.1 cupin domain-containing protein [Microvirga sp. STR05]